MQGNQTLNQKTNDIVEHVLVIGDVHGSDAWIELIDKHFLNPKSKSDAVNKVVFLGDYLDSYYTSAISQFANFKAIVDFKLKHFDDVFLLIGNHDHSYFRELTSRCPGYSHGVQALLNDNMSMEYLLENDIIQFAVEINDVIYSHGGISETWARELFEYEVNNMRNVLDENKIANFPIFRKYIVDNINAIYKLNKTAFNFITNFKPFDAEESAPFAISNKKGDDIWQSPLWIRPLSLLFDYLGRGLTPKWQVIGHTSSDYIIEFNNQSGVRIVMCDTNTINYKPKDFTGDYYQEYIIMTSYPGKLSRNYYKKYQQNPREYTA